MRILSRTVALLAVSGCMSNTARVDRNSAAAAEEVETAPVSTPQIETADSSSTPGPTKSGATGASSDSSAPSSPSAPDAAVEPEKTGCDAVKKEIQLPYFLKETSALVVGLEQTCKDQKSPREDGLLMSMSVVGVSCTGSPGFITRRGHSNQNWEVVSFGMDLGCEMRPPEEIKVVGKKKLGISVDPKIVSFVPMMVEYWEFEKNNDAGLGASPTLTANGGGAAQWKKNEVKNAGFPIKLYGHSSTLVREQAVYEARAILMPRSNQRQFQVLVEEMKLLTGDDLKSALERCMAKTNSKSACLEAFNGQ